MCMYVCITVEPLYKGQVVLCPLERGCPLLRGNKCTITMRSGNLGLQLVLCSEVVLFSEGPLYCVQCAYVCAYVRAYCIYVCAYYGRVCAYLFAAPSRANWRPPGSSPHHQQRQDYGPSHSQQSRQPDHRYIPPPPQQHGNVGVGVAGVMMGVACGCGLFVRESCSCDLYLRTTWS